MGTTVYAVRLFDDGDHYLGRVDYNFSERDRLYGSFMNTKVSSEAPNTRPAFTYLYPEGDSFFNVNETQSSRPRC